MKKVSLIIVMTIAVVLIGMAVWQLMWMSTVVNNYNPASPRKRSDPKVNMEKNMFQEKGTVAEITDHPSEQRPAEISNVPSFTDSSQVTDQSVKKSDEVINEPERTIADANRKVSSSLIDDKITIKEDENTISIQLKSEKPLPPQRQVIQRPSVSQRTRVDIPVPSVRQHATSTSPY